LSLALSPKSPSSKPLIERRGEGFQGVIDEE